MDFSNKVVLITGGSSGIGATAAILFSQYGADVAIVGRNETKLQDVAQKCLKYPLVIRADVSIEEDANKIVDETIEAFGKIDVLVNNAGIVRYSLIPSETFLQIYDEVLSTNLRAVVNITNLAIPFLIESKGNIINISSIAGSMTMPNLLVYGISKAGLNYFSQCLAADLAGNGIRVNTISPGPVRTDVWINANLDSSWETYEKLTPLGKISEPVELADLIMFLASDKARSVTGSNYVVDNGLMVKY